MTSRRFEVFTRRSGDTVFSTRFRVVARVVTRFVRTLTYDQPIPYVPTGCDLAPAAPVGVSCRFCSVPAVILTDEFDPACAVHADH